MPDTAIGLMARYPRTGTVKTRLARSIGDDRALKVYKSLLCKTGNLVTSLDPVDVLRTVFITPAEDCSGFKSEYLGFDRYCEQHGSGLGERMQEALGTLLSESGVHSAMLIGADCPALTTEHIRNAATLLCEHDLVLGPSIDGGYYLIGLKKVRPELFSEIKWGTSDVMKETLTAAKSLNLTTGLLPELRDLDDEQDLNQFDEIELI